MKRFKLLFFVAVAVPLSSVICGYAVSALADQNWRRWRFRILEPGCNIRPASFRLLKENRRRALASG